MCWRTVANFVCRQHPLTSYAYCPRAAPLPRVPSNEESLLPCVRLECFALSAAFQPETDGDPAPTAARTGEDMAAAKQGDATFIGPRDRSFRGLWLQGVDGKLHHVCRCFWEGCGCRKYDDELEEEAIRCGACKDMQGECLVRDAALDAVLKGTAQAKKA